jgi:hypothetical protein
MDVVKKSFVLLIILCFSCNESVQLKQEDVIKYDWLRPFVIEINNGFEGTHNIDNGILNFNYNVKDSNEIILKLDNVSLIEKWKINIVNDSTRIFTKDILIYGETLKRTNILVNFKRSENKLYFEID